MAVTGPSDIRRVEAGILGYGADIDLATNPFEAGLDRLVDLDKAADFIGKPTLRRIKAEGVKRRLVGVEIAGEPLPAPFTERWPVRDGAKAVGEITVAVHSPRLERNIGYAMLAVEHSALGSRLVIDTPWGEAAITVVEKPFVTARK